MAAAKRTRRKKARRNRARKRRQQRTIQLMIIALGVLLVGASAFWLLRDPSASAALEYHPEDVVYDRPLRAVHEMEGAKLNEIPFLPADGPQPKIAVSEDFYNFGTVGPNDVVTYEFAIFNIGDAPLTISRAYTTCSCTTADFTATIIPPGKVSIMTLTFDAGYHDVAGQTVRRGVIIENNDPTQPEFEIWVQASVARE